MIAPKNSAEHEHAWEMTRKGFTLLIPSHEQLRYFEPEARRELILQYWDTYDDRRSNNMFARSQSREECDLKWDVVHTRLDSLSHCINYVLRIRDPKETKRDSECFICG